MNHFKAIRIENSSLKKNIGLRGLADYIVMNYTDYEQEELLKFMSDPTKTMRIIIEVIDKPVTELNKQTEKP